MGKYKRLTTEQKAYIMKHYKEHKVIDIAAELGLSQGAVVSYANRHGLRKTEQDKLASVSQKELQYPAYKVGQRIKIPTQSGDKSWTRITRGATVLEVYENKRRVLLAIDGQCPGVQLRYDIHYFDLWANKAVII